MPFYQPTDEALMIVIPHQHYHRGPMLSLMNLRENGSFFKVHFLTLTLSQDLSSTITKAELWTLLCVPIVLRHRSNFILVT